MRRLAILTLISFLCAASPNSATADSRDATPQPVGTAMIGLTAFDVNDKTLELHYKITNPSNHDAWVCDTMYWPNKVLPADYEVYMDEDAKTLVIRRQIEVVGTESPAARRYKGQYALLRPGEERVGSFSLTIPVVRHPLLAYSGPDVNLATRVAVKIGVYNEDLPGKIQGLLNLATKLGYSSHLTSSFSSADWDPCFRYFPGFSIYDIFGGLSGFSNLWTEGSAQIDIPYSEWGLSLGDESALQITVDGVAVPIAH